MNDTTFDFSLEVELDLSFSSRLEDTLLYGIAKLLVARRPADCVLWSPLSNAAKFPFLVLVPW